MPGPAGVPLVLASMKRTGTLFNTFTTAKRIINDEDAVNIPGNFLSLGAVLKIRMHGAISNIVTTPGNLFFQVMMGTSNIIAFTTGNLALSATAHTLAPFKLDIDLRVDSIGITTSAKFLGMAEFGSIVLTNTDSVIQVPTTAPAVGTGFDSVAAAGNVLDLFAGFSISNAGNGVQLYSYDVLQTAGLAQ
jgi:hypothetical protein